jgi:NAD(P)-dependent dehydrogenase (short-subunit alcohol dehydrogenase family)
MKLDDFEAPPTPPTIYGPVRQIAYIVPNIDDAIAFLLSEDASYIHGTMVWVDGGTDAAIRPDLF